MEFTAPATSCSRIVGITRPRIATFNGRAPRHFNWALDWFDTIAAGNDRPALWIIDEDDTRDAAVVRGAEPLAPTRSPHGCATRACAAAIARCSCSATAPRCGSASSR